MLRSSPGTCHFFTLLHPSPNISAPATEPREYPGRESEEAEDQALAEKTAGRAGLTTGARMPYSRDTHKT
jgi:hypothetical protein